MTRRGVALPVAPGANTATLSPPSSPSLYIATMSPLESTAAVVGWMMPVAFPASSACGAASPFDMYANVPMLPVVLEPL